MSRPSLGPSVWVSVWALHMCDCANLGLRQQLRPDVSSWLLRRSCLFLTSLYSAAGQRKLRDGPLHNEKERGSCPMARKELAVQKLKSLGFSGRPLTKTFEASARPVFPLSRFL